MNYYEIELLNIGWRKFISLIVKKDTCFSNYRDLNMALNCYLQKYNEFCFLFVYPQHFYRV